MANRDKSEKVGFVYTNIYQLYKKSLNSNEPVSTEATAKAHSLSSDSRVWRAEDLVGVKVTKFEPRTLARVVAPNQALPSAAPKNGASPFDDLKSNLNKLEDLHSRLRFMLKELEDLVNKK